MSLRSVAGLLSLLLLLCACGLPLPDGVQSAGQVDAPGAEPPVVEVLTPGPERRASPEQILRGFLNAQISPADDHAVARQFLAPGTEWNAGAGARIYDVRTLRVVHDPADPLTFVVRVDSTARIWPDGSFSLVGGPVSLPYEVARQPDGEYRLVDVPPGLLLTTGDRIQSFRPHDVYFLARNADGTPAPQLVPDRVFLPVTADLTQALVDSLLDGPSRALNGSVTSAVPAGTTATTTVTPAAVAVDLSPDVLALDSRERQRLSAQLVWTLDRFAAVRLTVQGEPFEVPGADEVQDRADWREYDPDGFGGSGETDQPALYYVQNGLVRTHGGQALPDSEATQPGGPAVDEVAVSPSGGALALLSRGDGSDVLRVGPRAGPFVEALVKPGLRSPSWGSGRQGVWVLEPGPRSILWRVPGPGAASDVRPQPVSYLQPRQTGPLSTIRVSRDGARIALVFGVGEERRLYVGRIEPAGGQLQVVGVEAVAPALVDVTDVAWESGTSLKVLASDGAARALLWTVSVDGSAGPAPVQRQGLEGVRRSIAAMPGQPLVVATELDRREVLLADTGSVLLELDEPGAAPAYPG